MHPKSETAKLATLSKGNGVARQQRAYSQEFKLRALARFERAENVCELAQELGIDRTMLYRWERQFRAGGEAALKRRGRPSRSVELIAAIEAPDRIAELERTIGRQQVELDFFRAALQQVRGPRRRNGGPGDPTSTR